MKLWLDVDDLFYFAMRSVRPTGIQRLTGEAYMALKKMAPDHIGFVVHDDCPEGFRMVDWSEVQATYSSMTIWQGSVATVPPAPVEVISAARSPIGRILDRLLGPRAILPRFVPAGAPEKIKDENSDLGLRAGPSDVLCSLGAPWHDASYANRVARLIEQTGARFAILVHDLIPLLRPEYFEVGRAPDFAKVMRETLPLADVILANSQATARDVHRWADFELLRLKNAVQHIPIGTGFARPPASALPQGLDLNCFVLFVSTIEVRKNHLQAFRVWCRMLEEMPRERVPSLVFAGSPGWMTEDLMKAIESTNRLDGKLVLIQGADDATLSALYQQCLFTLFLSYYEGWGLPVSDSLAFGKICVASNRTSIPEAGGDFCVYVDPDNTTGAYETIRQLIETPTELARLERHLSMKFRPIPWSTTAEAVLRATLGDSQNITPTHAPVDELPNSTAHTYQAQNRCAFDCF